MGRFIPGRKDGDSSPSASEFSANDSEIFRTLAGAMTIVGFISIAFGALQIAAAVRMGMHTAGVLTLGQGAAVFIIGVWIASAAGSFKAVANTEGIDTAHLMIALTRLRSAFRLQAVMLLLACGLILASLVLK